MVSFNALELQCFYLQPAISMHVLSLFWVGFPWYLKVPRTNECLLGSSLLCELHLQNSVYWFLRVFQQATNPAHTAQLQFFVFFFNLVHASIIQELLLSACLQNQHHVANTKLCFQLDLELGFLFPMMLFVQILAPPPPRPPTGISFQMKICQMSLHFKSRAFGRQSLALRATFSVVQGQVTSFSLMGLVSLTVLLCQHFQLLSGSFPRQRVCLHIFLLALCSPPQLWINAASSNHALGRMSTINIMF